MEPASERPREGKSKFQGPAVRIRTRSKGPGRGRVALLGTPDGLRPWLSGGFVMVLGGGQGVREDGWRRSLSACRFESTTWGGWLAKVVLGPQVGFSK